MNSSKFEDGALRPTYMSQAEANEVMELWAERQREEAARQSLITVHDVAEATQLSTQDVERLLQEVRSSRPETTVRVRRAITAPRTASSEPTLLEAYVRLAPITAALSFLLGTLLSHYSNYMYIRGGIFSIKELAETLWLYAIAVALVYGAKWLKNRLTETLLRHRGSVGNYGR